MVCEFEGHRRQVDAVFAPKSDTVPVKLEGSSSHSVPVRPAKVTSPLWGFLIAKTSPLLMLTGALLTAPGTAGGSVSSIPPEPSLAI